MKNLYLQFGQLIFCVALGGVTQSTLANHLHYIDVTDKRYAPDHLVDIVGPDPIHEWIAFTGNDDYSTFSNGGLTYAASSGTGTVRAVFDYPVFEDINNDDVTAFFEIEITALDQSGIQTLEVAIGDLANEVKYDEAAGAISGSRAGVQGFDVDGLPRLSEIGSLPYRIQLYYHFDDTVFSLRVLDAERDVLAQWNWASDGVNNPFQNFYPDGIGGTDPDNLSIYPQVFCEAQCEVTMADWDRLNCSTSDGEVLIDHCGAIGPAPPVFDSQFADHIEAISIPENASGMLIDVDARDGNGGDVDSDISYSIRSGNIDRDGDTQPPFTIDTGTGVVSVNDPDDLSLGLGDKYFYLTIDASDDAEPYCETSMLIVSLGEVAEACPVPVELMTFNVD